MASTGPALWPGSSTFPNTTVYPGQGSLPIIRALVSFDSFATVIPSWTDYTPKLRSYSVDRGRSTEQSEFDAGTADVVFDNNDRNFDPLNNANVKPMNRLWLYEEFSSERQDLFHGYAESWEQAWDQSGLYDATATMHCADEFKVLALLQMPVTSPVRSSYDQVVGSDLPESYWRLNDPPALAVQDTSDPQTNYDIDFGLWGGPVSELGWVGGNLPKRRRRRK